VTKLAVPFLPLVTVRLPSHVKSSPNIDLLSLILATVPVRSPSAGNRLDHVSLPLTFLPISHLCRPQMSLHTAQHLLSSVIDTSLNVSTLTWSLTPWPSPAYIDLPRPLTAVEISQVQDQVNCHVFEGRCVHVEVDELQEGQAGINLGQPAASSRKLGRGLPTDYSGGIHHMMVINGIDRTRVVARTCPLSPLCSSSCSHPRLPRQPLPPDTTSSQARACSTTSVAYKHFSHGPWAPSCVGHQRPQNVSRLLSKKASEGRSASTISSVSWPARWVVSSQKKWRNGVLLVQRANGPNASVERMTRRLHERSCKQSLSPLQRMFRNKQTQCANSHSYSCPCLLLRHLP
jgi:hypothetical protein